MLRNALPAIHFHTEGDPLQLELVALDTEHAHVYRRVAERLDRAGYKADVKNRFLFQDDENERDTLAERVGFEPTVGFLLHTLSKRAP